MIKVNKSTINLNFETQFDKNGRPFRLSGTISNLYGEVTHIFRRLDTPSGLFSIKVDRFGKFMEFREPILKEDGFLPEVNDCFKNKKK